MAGAVEMVEIWRGDLLESVHRGHAVVCDEKGEIVQAWGDPTALIYPRSACKMIQVLPLIESGAAEAFSLNAEQLALACASHQGAAIHTDRVGAWLNDLSLDDSAFRCGPQMPNDKDARYELIRAHEEPCQIHNNCSGKHAGFLTLNKHIGGDADYELIDHPMQQMIKQTFEEMTEETSPGFGIDGCSAPNHACTVHGFARALSFFATAHERSDRRSTAAVALREAMWTYPELVAGETRACTDLMRAMNGKVALKGGAEAVYAAIIPELKLSVAMKIVDGASRASECVIATILANLGVLDRNHPNAIKYINPEIKNWRGTVTGYMRASACLAA